MKAVATSLLLVFWGLTATACIDQGSGVMRAESLMIADCGEAGVWTSLEMEFSYLSVLRATDAAVIRVSTTSQMAPVSDSLVITVENYAAVRAQIAAEGAATLPLGADGSQVSMSMLDTCPESMIPLIGVNGSVTFTQLGTLTGDRISAELEFDLIDARTLEIVGPAFDVSFDFEVQAGTPHENFSDPRRQHGE